MFSMFCPIIHTFPLQRMTSEQAIYDYLNDDFDEGPWSPTNSRSPSRSSSPDNSYFGRDFNNRYPVPGIISIPPHVSASIPVYAPIPVAVPVTDPVTVLDPVLDPVTVQVPMSMPRFTDDHRKYALDFIERMQVPTTQVSVPVSSMAPNQHPFLREKMEDYHPNRAFIRENMHGFDAWTPGNEHEWKRITCSKETVYVPGRECEMVFFNFGPEPHHTGFYFKEANQWKLYDPFCGPIALYTGLSVLQKRAGRGFIFDLPKQLREAGYTQQMLDRRELVHEEQLLRMLHVFNYDNRTSYNIAFFVWANNKESESGVYTIHPLSRGVPINENTICLALKPGQDSQNDGHWVLGCLANTNLPISSSSSSSSSSSQDHRASLRSSDDTNDLPRESNHSLELKDPRAPRLHSRTIQKKDAQFPPQPIFEASTNTTGSESRRIIDVFDQNTDSQKPSDHDFDTFVHLYTGMLAFGMLEKLEKLREHEQTCPPGRPLGSTRPSREQNCPPERPLHSTRPDVGLYDAMMTEVLEQMQSLGDSMSLKELIESYMNNVVPEIRGHIREQEALLRKWERGT